jgi:hypothetical protein
MKQAQAFDDGQEGTVAELVLAMYIRTDAPADGNFGVARLDGQKQSAPLGELVDLPEGNTGLNLKDFPIAIKIKKAVESTVFHTRN